jgi:uncharacterized membrane protein YhhN
MNLTSEFLATHIQIYCYVVSLLHCLLCNILYILIYCRSNLSTSLSRLRRQSPPESLLMEGWSGVLWGPPQIRSN